MQFSHVAIISKPGFWLAGNSVASQSETMLENLYYLTDRLTQIF